MAAAGHAVIRMKVNYHIHTSYSGDLIRENILSETPEKYVKKAIALGFSEICFTDHVVAGYPRTQSPYTHSMDTGRISEYVSEIRALKGKYPAIGIRLGIEADWMPEKLAELRAFVGMYPFDCVLGSVHIMNGEHVEHCSRESREKFWGTLSEEGVYAQYQAYYRAVQDMAESRICDIISHIDLIKRDSYVPKKSFWPLIEKTVDAIARNGLCIEINTAGIRKPIKEMHPALEILSLCRQKGIPVTIGTDAHRVEELEVHLEDGMRLIKKAGYTEIAVFDARKRKMIPV